MFISGIMVGAGQLETERDIFVLLGISLSTTEIKMENREQNSKIIQIHPQKKLWMLGFSNLREVPLGLFFVLTDKFANHTLFDLEQNRRWYI